MVKARKGFTLLELITVVIIIGILALIAVPQFFKVAERARGAEAINTLGVLRNAQLRYAAEHGTTSTNTSDLDINLTTLRFFDVTTTGLDAVPALNTSDDSHKIAEVTRGNVSNPGYGAYTIEIHMDGSTKCSGTNDICKLLGIPSS